MKMNLKRAVRVFRALVESPVKVDSATIRSWPHLERAISHDKPLLTEMQNLPVAQRARVQAYVGEFAPLEESRPVYQLPDAREASRFIQEVDKVGGTASHLDGGGLVAASGPDFVQIESLAAELGGVAYHGPSLADDYDYVDRTLPEALFIESGADANLCESALLEAIDKSETGSSLNESMFVGIKSEGPLAQFRTRLDTFAQPKRVLGVTKSLAEAVRISGLATPAMLSVMEAGDNPAGVSPGGDANGGDPSDRGGIAKDQPDSRAGQPANSRNGEQQQQQPPTEHVPSQEQGGASNAVRLPDGTEVPFDVMKQAFAKMLHNMASQVENGTMGGQPAPRGADQADATGTEPPQPSTAQQQVAAQSASQQAAGNGAEPPAQPAQANGEPAQEAPPQAQPNGEQPAPENGEQPPAQPGQEAPAQPGEQPAAPEQAPAGDPAADELMDRAEQGDAEALKQAQGMQGSMSDEQKQRLQQILAGQQQDNGVAPQQAESFHRILESLDDREYGLLQEVLTKKDFIRVAEILRTLKLSDSDKRVVTLEFIAWFKEQNPRFDRDRFMKAVGLGESINESRRSGGGMSESIRDALRLMDSSRERDLIQAIDMVRSESIKRHPSKLVERLLDRLNALAAHQSRTVRDAASTALSGLYEAATKGSFTNTQLGHSTTGSVGDYAGTASGEDTLGSVSKAFGKGKKSYKKKANESCVVWTPAEVVPAVTLPEGLDYQSGGCEPGDHAVLIEAGPDTSLVRTMSGDTVRVSNEHLQMESGGFVGGELVEAQDLASIIESISGGDIVLVMGPPSAGKGYFINKVIGPCISEGRDLPAVLKVAVPWQAMQERTAREDFSVLVAEARDEESFDQALMGPRFRYVAESGHEMLRDAITWREFQRFERRAARRGMDEAFAGFFAHPRVGSYYSDMRGGHQGTTEHVFRDRMDEAIIGLRDVLVVDCAPNTAVREFVEAAQQCEVGVHLVEFVAPLRHSIARSKLRESQVRRACNEVSENIASMARDGVLDSHMRYVWEGNEHVGRFVMSEALKGFTYPHKRHGAGLKPGKFASKQIVKGNQGEEGEPEKNKPKMRKDIAVRESIDERFVEMDHDQWDYLENSPGVMSRDGGRTLVTSGPGGAHMIAQKLRGKVFVDDEFLSDMGYREVTMRSGKRVGAGPPSHLRDFGRKSGKTYGRRYGMDPVHGAAYRRGENPASYTESINEQLDTGQAAESESCAEGMKEAGTLLSDARAAIFKLTTSTLVQCSSMAQATGMKKTQGLLEKAQQAGAKFLDEIKTMGDLVQKANESMKAENGGMGGDNMDAIKQQAAAMNGNGAEAAPTPAPAPAEPAVPAPAPAAPAVPAPAPDVAVGEAISSVIGTPFMEAVKSGADYRALNESLRGYCPTLNTRQRTQVIDRLKAVALLPENANLRVGFSAADHRLLAESATFGSMTAALADRTSGNRQTYASPDELNEAVRSLRTKGGAMHLHLAETLERGLVQSALNEGRKEVGDSLKDSSTMNVARASVREMVDAVEAAWGEAGVDPKDDLGNYPHNINLLKSSMQYAKNIPRDQMPVIEPKDIKKFEKDLTSGRVDIFAPWAKEHLERYGLFAWEKSKKPMFNDKHYIELGIADGAGSDDVVQARIEYIPVKKLKPLQGEIWFHKVIGNLLYWGIPKQGGVLTDKAIVIVSKEGYILDGHHRFGQAMTANPNLKLKALRVPLDIDLLLKVGRSYGSALGHHAKT
jgi:hypothetical protein